MFFLEFAGVIEIQPEFEFVAYLVVSSGKKDFSAVFQVKIIVGLTAFAKNPLAG
jgi:hypothetical protein